MLFLGFNYHFTGNNALTGSIPSEIGLMKSLELLVLCKL